MGSNSTYINDKWLKASVLAGLWAGIEIIAGSFLHNLKIPLSGTFLTMISVILVLGFFQIWPLRGIMWRAGLITALMKSISPSAIILGPMVAIFMEGLLLEITVLLLGKNLIGYIAGGVITLLGALMQKIVRVWMMYGLDIFKIYENIYQVAVKQLGVTHASPVPAVATLFIVYAALGAFAAFAGYSIGKRARNMQSNSLPNSNFTSYNNSWEEQPENNSYSTVLLILHLVALPILLFLPHHSPWLLSTAVTVMYLIFIAIHYKHALKRLKKLLFWAQLLLILALAWFFSDTPVTSVEPKLLALADGFNMVLRALIVVMGFSAISTELRAPVMQRLFYRGGLRQLYLAINTAFSILPEVVDNFAKPRDFLKKPFGSIAYSLQYVNGWHQKIKERHS
jgi:hypothetical protein